MCIAAALIALQVSTDRIGLSIIHGVMECMGIWKNRKICDRAEFGMDGLENLFFHGSIINFSFFDPSIFLPPKKGNVISDRADVGVDDHRATGHEILLPGS